MADLNIATLSGDYTVISEAEVKDFRSSLHGETLLPDDAGYDGVRRIWNAMINKRASHNRPLQRSGGRGQFGQLRQGEEPADFGARRRP